MKERILYVTVSEMNVGDLYLENPTFDRENAMTYTHNMIDHLTSFDRERRDIYVMGCKVNSESTDPADCLNALMDTGTGMDADEYYAF